MREEITPASRAEDEDWTIPADRRGNDDDPWLIAIDDLATDEELLFPYPAGLP